MLRVMIKLGFPRRTKMAFGWTPCRRYETCRGDNCGVRVGKGVKRATGSMLGVSISHIGECWPLGERGVLAYRHYETAQDKIAHIPRDVWQRLESKQRVERLSSDSRNFIQISSKWLVLLTTREVTR